MDLMDLDDIVEVPDTPDRLPKHGIRTENQRSPLPCHGHKMVFEEGSREQPMIIDSGSPALSLHPPKCPSSPKNHRRPPTSASFSLSSSSSSRNTPLFRKGVAEKKPNYLTHGSVHKHQESLKPSNTSQSSSSSQDGILDMGEWSHRPACGNASLSAVPGKNQADLQKRSVLPNGASSSRELSNLANASHNVNEEMNNFARGGFGIAFGEGALHGGNNKKKPDVSPVHIVPPRVNKQKRLVRNGCISPNNIAKAKQLVGKDSSSSVAVAKNNGSIVSNAPPVSIEIRELVAEDNDSLARKGKGAISQPGRLDPETNNFHGRSSMSYNEKAVERTGYNGGAGKSFEGRGGCKTTCNWTRETDNLSSFDKEHHSTRERVSPRISIQHHENTLDRRGKGITPANGDNHSKDLNTLIKRQKHRSGLSRHGECSTSTSVDPDVVLLSSPTEAGSLRSTTSNAKNIPQVIDVVESPPQVRCATHDEDDKVRQVEADEILARELQEQFYNEMPVFGVPEVNEHIASRSQNGLSRGLSREMQAIEAVNEHIASRVQNGLSRGLSRGMQAIEARLMADLRRQSSRPSSNSRRGALARSSSLGRMTRQRSRFPGQPRTLSSSRGRTSIFPPDMDVDMRMHILGALEEFSGMGTTAGILHADRDFNEDDYEMLLALDDNISHGGASAHQINGLPLSTAQSDFEEACAVCLDTPTAGDTIRHLPCLHKFHKDCIDPWLRRRTSCPVCKSSIT